MSTASEKQQEINAVSREFNRSLSIGHESKISDDGNASKTSPSTTNIQEPKDDKRFVAPKDFELLKVIGMGAFGKVLQVRNRKSSEILAMKVISKRLLKRKTSYVENVLAERNILSKIANHPFIVTMHASFQTKEKLFIIMDFCAGGELFLKLGREGIFRERTAAFYIAEITLALEHLHSVNVLHRDLKPENILLGADGHCCLTDFGLAKDFTGNNSENEDERARTLCGTMEYMAPEMVARKWYGKGADFWSLGCIAFEMLSGLPPFSQDRKGSKELFRKIMNERIRMPEGASASACKLLKGLLNRDVNKRLGASKGTMFEVGGVGALKQQPFFSGLDWGKLELKEIEPPEDFSVSHDEDLRHFHEEFTKMALPRSVKEMSKLDFLPRHCKSDHFKGFSFIGDHFALPERTSSEEMHYWNNVDGDGQSLSDCASDIFDDDLGTAPAEPTPEKKKRPPRKKKNKQTIPLETAKEEDEKKEATAADDEDDTKDGSLPAQKDVTSTTEQGPATNQIIPNAADVPKLPQASQPASASMPSTVNITPKTPASLNPNAKAWSAVGPPSSKVAVSSSTTCAAFTTARPSVTKQQPITSMRQSPTPVSIGNNPNLMKPPVVETYNPKPGSWASMAVGRNPAPQSAMVIPVTAVPRPAAQSSMKSPHQATKPPVKVSALSPDWRNHVVSPHRSPQRKISAQNVSLNIDDLPPPPSLGDDFGPPLGAKIGTAKQTKPMGAWGAKM